MYPVIRPRPVLIVSQAFFGGFVRFFALRICSSPYMTIHHSNRAANQGNSAHRPADSCDEKAMGLAPLGAPS
jgi:hypothetical protein